MSITNMSLAQFQKEVEKIIKLHIQKGFIAENVDVKKLAETVTNKLQNDKSISLSETDVKENAGIQKAVGLACIAECNPKNSFDYSVLFKNQNEIDQKEFKKELKNIFTEAMKLNPTYKNKSSEEKEKLDNELDELAEFVSEKLLKNDSFPLAENQYALNFVAASVDMLNEQRAEFYRELYGAAEPGEVRRVVEAVPYGDQIGLEDMASMGDSFQAKKNDANPGV